MKAFFRVGFVVAMLMGVASIFSSESVVQSLGQLQNQLELLSARIEPVLEKRYSVDPKEAQELYKAKASKTYRLALTAKYEIPKDFAVCALANVGTIFCLKRDDSEHVYELGTAKEPIQIKLLDGWTVFGFFSESLFSWTLYQRPASPVLLSKRDSDEKNIFGIFDTVKKVPILIDVIDEKVYKAVSDSFELPEYPGSFNNRSILVGSQESGYYFVTNTRSLRVNLKLGKYFDATNNYIVWASDKNVYLYDVIKNKSQEVFKLVNSTKMIRQLQIREYDNEIIVVVFAEEGSGKISREQVFFGELTVCSYKKDMGWQRRRLDTLWPVYFNFRLSDDGKKCVSIAVMHDDIPHSNVREIMPAAPRILLLDREEYVMADLPEKYKKAEIMIASDDGNYVAVQSGRDVLLWHLEKKLIK